jgi:hypothetical protein
VTKKSCFRILFDICFEPQTHDDYLIHALEYHIFVLDQLYLKTGKLAGYVKIFDLEEFRLKVRVYVTSPSLSCMCVVCVGVCVYVFIGCWIDLIYILCRVCGGAWWGWWLQQVNVLNQWRKNTAKQVERLGVNILECYPELYAKVHTQHTHTHTHTHTNARTHTHIQ